MANLKTQTANKPANKPASIKASPKAESKAKPAAKKQTFFAALYAMIKAGEMGERVAAYYKRADDYHAKQKTVFPRVKTESERAEMTKAKAQSVIEKAAKGILAAGSIEGQAVYDLMRTGADCTK